MAGTPVNHVLKFKDRQSFEDAIKIIHPTETREYKESVKSMRAFLNAGPKVTVVNRRGRSK
ncbi:hypothetical protein [Lacticaseibacillus zeae]|uniref:Uncharacterized protein n=1 Tax=Lacticaseibacillus zeae subsp. silagei TaxID=3068307 RepID=A0ABD7Z894_LACZE|nr:MULTISPECIES: hypothetical protein [Lacticaseibacillus]MDE3316583.1 hypothetical protein [Lacticaseibacillus zeae]OFR97019.1 hypothetical protein HMPREF2861_07550 [Lactobacillus sp. HMSC068F07]WLV83379.1 hypothetical protein LACZS2_002615 [Lacticaseibacillus sp. NCIMB 15475]WLV86128.1 hypothetical protein LACZS1_002564 [Lacticaseibacillus sp. NCIMB 15474]